MKILVINPSLRLHSPTKYLPVGIGSVMTFIHQHGYNFDLLDIDINDYDNEYVENYIATHDYDVFMSGAIATHYKWMKWLCKIIKEYHPKSKIIIGNSVAGSIPEVFLRNSKADVAVIGEGEFGALDVLNSFRDGKSLQEVEGIAFLDSSGNFIKTGKRKACNINELPLVDWDLFDIEKYFSKSDHMAALGIAFDKTNAPRHMPVATARGCAFKCTFCHYVFWNDPFRVRTPENILKEIKRNISKYGATYISFWDDLSFSTLRQAEEIADAILDSGLKFNWNATIRADLFGHPGKSYDKRKAVAQKLRESGCLNLGFSLESGNQKILDMMKKHMTTDHFISTVKILKEVDIVSNTSVVLGYPIETKESIQETFDMCLRAGVYPSIGYLLPLPATVMYGYAKDHGFITDEDAYLDSITERQDLCLNMTALADEEIMFSIQSGARQLNKSLELGLSEQQLIKTGGYRNQDKKTAKNINGPIDPDNLKRIENDVSFNYSQALFDIDLRKRTQQKIEAEEKKESQQF
jgi:anaerobic magnesium-protoporphyrin IX monomethyl ester cyclase